MRRREFLSVLGSAAAMPLAARAQALPVVGYLNGASAKQFPHLLAAFKRGLGELGFVERRNVALEYRFADGNYETLPALAAELVNQRVAVIFASAGTPTALAAKAASSTIPVVFAIGGDPVTFKLVDSLNRPGGNVTGVTMVAAETVAKRMELLLEMIPAAQVFGVLANLSNPMTSPQLTELNAAGRMLGKQLKISNASSDNELAAAFAAFAQAGVQALVVAADPFFDDRRSGIVALAARYSIPASYTRREFVIDGGLASYGTDNADSIRHAGIYVGRILKGERPYDLPVQQPTKYQLVINLKTAKSLGLTMPPTLLASATEVIE